MGTFGGPQPCSGEPGETNEIGYEADDDFYVVSTFNLPKRTTGSSLISHSSRYILNGAA